MKNGKPSSLGKTQNINWFQHFRAEIDFTGPIEQIPINANKDGVSFNRALVRTKAAFEKIAGPYLSAVSFLSQEGRTRLVNSMTKDNPHREAELHAPAVDLGHWYEASVLPREVRADTDRFKIVIAAELDELEPRSVPGSDSVAAPRSMDFVPSPPSVAVEPGEDEPDKPESMQDWVAATERPRVLGTCTITGSQTVDRLEVAQALRECADKFAVELDFDFGLTTPSFVEDLIARVDGGRVIGDD